MQNNPEDYVTDKAIDIAFGNANFGERLTKREVVNGAVLKCAAGFYTGHTAQCIIRELGLVDSVRWQLTELGRQYLMAAFSGGISI